MARLRKTGKIWRRADASVGARLMVADADYFSIDPDSLFYRPAPLEVEIGAGRGELILNRGGAVPEHNFLAVELSLPLVQLLAERAASAQLRNVRVARMDARPLVNLFLPDDSVSAYHIYFPDPWPKVRHAKNRLFTPLFVANLQRTMKAGGLLLTATDVAPYADSIFSMIHAQGFRATNEPIAKFGTTGFARKFMSEGRKIYAQAFVK
jgi:tRNA (guanine-N7-)-methyltransferase